MALGAVGDTDLARRVGQAIGTELRALGVNVAYAPVADVASRPGNPSLGIRAFGENPEMVASMTAAMVVGLQSAGVAATLKHFPGEGRGGSGSALRASRSSISIGNGSRRWSGGRFGPGSRPAPV